MLNIEKRGSAQAGIPHSCTHLAKDYNIMEHPKMLQEKFDHFHFMFA